MYLSTAQFPVHRLFCDHFACFCEGEHVKTPTTQHIIDACSLLRHKLVLSMYFIGGSTERIRPTLTDPIGPLFSSLPPPQIFMLTESEQHALPDEEIGRWLQDYCVAACDDDPSVVSEFRQRTLQQLWGYSASSEVTEPHQRYACFKLEQSSASVPPEIEVCMSPLRALFSLGGTAVLTCVVVDCCFNFCTGLCATTSLQQRRTHQGPTRSSHTLSMQGILEMARFGIYEPSLLYLRPACSLQQCHTVLIPCL